MQRFFQPGRHLPLMLALIAVFLLYPVMLELGKVRWMRFAFLMLLAFAVYGLAGRERRARWPFLLVVPAAVGQMVAYYYSTRAVLLCATGLALLFLVAVTIAVLRSVVAEGRVTADRIAGAITVYLLIGLCWALAFGFVGVADPAAFRGDEISNGAVPLPEIEYGLVYYSFVTLTSLGYGEIVPVSPIARTLAWMEAVTGQLFLAILVARLVALHVAHTASRD